MGHMKKFTRSQKVYVDRLEQNRLFFQGKLVETARELKDLKRAHEELDKKAVETATSLTAELGESKKRHRELLNAVEDFELAEQDFRFARQKYEGTLGRMSALSTEQDRGYHGVPQEGPLRLALGYDNDTNQWGSR